MKIAFVVDQFPCLSETFILNQITGLLDRGHEVRIFARRVSSESVVQPEVEAYNLRRRTHYISIPSNKLVRVLGGIFRIAGNLPKNSVAVLRALNVFRCGEAAVSLHALYVAVAFLEDFDIVHCQFGSNGNFAIILKKLGIRAKLITSFYGYDVRVGIKRGGSIYRTLFEEGDYFFACSPWVYQNLIGLGLDERKIVYHRTGIDLRRFPCRWESALSSNGGSIRVLTTARLVEEKGLEFGIRAIHKLLQQRSGLSLIYDIIGGGPLEGELRRLIQELALNGVVRLLGPLNQTQIVETLRGSDIFLLPSVTESSPPVALMESQAVGLPAVATATGNADQIVLDGKSGFLVPVGDVDALAEKLGWLIDHPQTWIEMGRAGRKIVEENFDIGRLNDRLVRIYQRIIHGRPPNSGHSHSLDFGDLSSFG